MLPPAAERSCQPWCAGGRCCSTPTQRIMLRGWGSARWRLNVVRGRWRPTSMMIRQRNHRCLWRRCRRCRGRVWSSRCYCSTTRGSRPWRYWGSCRRHLAFVFIIGICSPWLFPTLCSVGLVTDVQLLSTTIVLVSRLDVFRLLSTFSSLFNANIWKEKSNVKISFRKMKTVKNNEWKKNAIVAHLVRLLS